MPDITKRNSNVHFILGNTGHAGHRLTVKCLVCEDTSSTWVTANCKELPAYNNVTKYRHILAEDPSGSDIRTSHF